MAFLVELCAVEANIVIFWFSPNFPYVCFDPDADFFVGIYQDLGSDTVCFRSEIYHNSGPSLPDHTTKLF